MPEGYIKDIEHIWAGPFFVPEKLQNVFPNGVVIVFSDDEFTAAIPATREEAIQLIDLFEDGNREYFAMRDKLCGEFSYNQLSLLWLLEMKKAQKEDERHERGGKYAKMASAARFN